MPPRRPAALEGLRWGGRGIPGCPRCVFRCVSRCVFRCVRVTVASLRGVHDTQQALKTRLRPFPSSRREILNEVLFVCVLWAGKGQSLLSARKKINRLSRELVVAAPVMRQEAFLLRPAIGASYRGQLSGPAIGASHRGQLSGPAIGASHRGQPSGPAIGASYRGQLSGPAIGASYRGQPSGPAIGASYRGQLSGPAIGASYRGKTCGRRASLGRV